MVGFSVSVLEVAFIYILQMCNIKGPAEAIISQLGERGAAGGVLLGSSIGLVLIRYVDYYGRPCLHGLFLVVIGTFLGMMLGPVLDHGISCEFGTEYWGIWWIALGSIVGIYLQFLGKMSPPRNYLRKFGNMALGSIVAGFLGCCLVVDTYVPAFCLGPFVALCFSLGAGCIVLLFMDLVVMLCDRKNDKEEAKLIMEGPEDLHFLWMCYNKDFREDDCHTDNDAKDFVQDLVNERNTTVLEEMKNFFDEFSKELDTFKTQRLEPRQDFEHLSQSVAPGHGN